MAGRADGGGARSGATRQGATRAGAKPGKAATGQKQSSPHKVARWRHSGRTTSSKTSPTTSGRYTPPIPKEQRHSPRWYPWMLIGLLVLGVLTIIMNYIDALPASPSDGYVIAGLVFILAGAMLATTYR